MRLILVSVYALIICIGILCIMFVRRKKTAGGTESPDIISVISNYNRKRLASKPWNMKYETYTAIGTIVAIILAVSMYLYRGMAYAIGGAVIGFLVPEAIVYIRSTTQRQKFEERYARSLRQLSAALKSGLTLHQAVEEVSHSIYVHEQIRKEFQQLSTDLKLGISVPDAFERFAERVGGPDAADVAIAVKMQSKTGGREGAVIETIAKKIGDRMLLKKEVNSLFAGSNMTILVLDIIPFAAVFIMLFGASQFMNIYFESVAMLMIFITLMGVMGIGSIITHRMVSKMRKECGIQ